MTKKQYYELHKGNNLEILPKLIAAGVQVDAVITDPPYHLTSIVDRFSKTSNEDNTKTSERTRKGSDGYARLAKGFMGKEWDGVDSNGVGIAHSIELWSLVYKILKPGGYLLAFSGTRTQHKMVTAIENSGFLIKDQIGWCFGSGFPKSHNIAKQINKQKNLENKEELEEKWTGWGTALKPAWEPICVAQKPLEKGLTYVENVIKYYTGSMNIDACRVPLSKEDNLQKEIIHDGHNLDTSNNEGSWGFKAVNRQAGLGRWPANLIHDNSSEVLAEFAKFGNRTGGSVTGNEPSDITNNIYGEYAERKPFKAYGDEGSAAKYFKSCPVEFPENTQDFIKDKKRGTGGFWKESSGLPCGPTYLDSGNASRFFYSAKASSEDRVGSKHPTIKPLSLMKYLCRLVTPPNGIILDIFAGSGTTGQAAIEEGFYPILVELMPEYQVDIENRLKSVVEKTEKNDINKELFNNLFEVK